LEYRLFPEGDCAVLIETGKEMNLENHRKVQAISALLEDYFPSWMCEWIPAFTTVTVIYDPFKVYNLSGENPFTYVSRQLIQLLSALPANHPVHTRTVDIPVCYGGEFGPDLEEVARMNHLTPEEVIETHAAGDYLVYMIGFAPGFPYIGGMSKKIAAPRRKTPRLKIPERSVGIAGIQTGVYPIETPGGWQIIGRTPLRLFEPENDPPSLLQAGDKIRFFPISPQEYRELEMMEP
jgi:inhibitor of KinA